LGICFIYCTLKITPKLSNLKQKNVMGQESGKAWPHALGSRSFMRFWLNHQPELHHFKAQLGLEDPFPSYSQGCWQASEDLLPS
jgi:hypothetical protein